MYKVRFKGACLVLLFSEPKYIYGTLINSLVSLIGLEHPLWLDLHSLFFNIISKNENL
jgi:hypothetical protein